MRKKKCFTKRAEVIKNNFQVYMWKTICIFFSTIFLMDSAWKWKYIQYKKAQKIVVSLTHDDRMMEIGKSWISCLKEMMIFFRWDVTGYLDGGFCCYFLQLFLSDIKR